MTSQQEDKLYGFCSGIFLTCEVPEGFGDLPDDQQLQFIEEHKWLPVEGKSAQEVLDLIDNTYQNLLVCLDEGGIK